MIHPVVEIRYETAEKQSGDFREKICEGGMPSRKIKEYIAEHTFCSEYLFKDWESFLDLLYAEGGRISSILWWDHCRKSQHHESVGSGGYTDPENEEYVYAETQFYKEDLEMNTLDEIKEYIKQGRKNGFRYGSKYKSHDLVPSFCLESECLIQNNGNQSMKEVMLSADGDSVVYLVPAAVAENLEEYCLKFCSEWLWNDPEAEKYRDGKAVSYTYGSGFYCIFEYLYFPGL